jgi:predicted  nucleic acid-binding Zn-ribbon protein
MAIDPTLQRTLNQIIREARGIETEAQSLLGVNPESPELPEIKTEARGIISDVVAFLGTQGVTPPTPTPVVPPAPTPTPPVTPGPTPGPTPEPTPAPADAEEAGKETKKAVDESSKEADAAKTESDRAGKEAEDLRKQIADLQSKLTDAQRKASETTIRPTPEGLAAFQKDMDALIGEIAKAAQKLKNLYGYIGRIRNLKAKLEEAIARHGTLIADAADIKTDAIEAKIASLPDSDRKTKLLADLQKLKGDVKTLNDALRTLTEVTGRLQRHMQFVQDAQLAVLYSDLSKRIKDVMDNINSIRAKMKELIDKKEESQAVIAQTLSQVRMVLADVGNNMAAMLRSYEDIRNRAGYNAGIVAEIQKDLRQWTAIYTSLVSKAFRTIKTAMANMEEQITIAQTRVMPKPAAPEAAAQEAPELVEILQTVFKQKISLESVMQTVKVVIEKITFTETMQKRATKADIEKAATSALDAAQAEAKFDKDSIVAAQKLLDALKKADEHISARLAMPDIPATEKKRLEKLRDDLKGFLEFEERALVPILIDMDETIKEIVVSIIKKGKLSTVSGAALTSRVKAKLATLLEKVDNARKMLAVRQSEIQAAIKKPARTKPRTVY